MIRLVVRHPGTLLGREVQPGDLIGVDLESAAPVVFVAELPRNVGQLLGAIVDGTVEPIDLSPDAAAQLLAPPPSSPRSSRVLDITARLGSASSG